MTCCVTVKTLTVQNLSINVIIVCLRFVTNVKGNKIQLNLLYYLQSNSFLEPEKPPREIVIEKTEAQSVLLSWQVMGTYDVIVRFLVS